MGSEGVYRMGDSWGDFIEKVVCFIERVVCFELVEGVGVLDMCWGVLGCVFEGG